MSEKSVSQIANERREKDHEASRKALSPNKGATQNSNTNCGREEQRRTSVAEGQLNLGSNVNMGRTSEQSQAPEQKPSGGFSYTKEQFERKHEQAPVVEKGTPDNRKTVKSGASLGRHVQSDNGFKIADRRSAHVRSERKNTERTFDSRRKRSSTV
jgi:hypothetical protein